MLISQRIPVGKNREVNVPIAPTQSTTETKNVKSLDTMADFVEDDGGILE